MTTLHVDTLRHPRCAFSQVLIQFLVLARFFHEILLISSWNSKTLTELLRISIIQAKDSKWGPLWIQLALDETSSGMGTRVNYDKLSRSQSINDPADI